VIDIQALGLDDIIEPHDLVRDIYSNREFDKRVSLWMEAQTAIPFWVGKSLRDFYCFPDGKVPAWGIERNHQILRVPESSREEGGFIVNDKLEISLS
jgi:hypothetical protein